MSSSPSLAAGIPNSSVPCIVTDLFMVSIFFFFPKRSFSFKGTAVLAARHTGIPFKLQGLVGWPYSTSMWTSAFSLGM